MTPLKRQTRQLPHLRKPVNPRSGAVCPMAQSFKCKVMLQIIFHGSIIECEELTGAGCDATGSVTDACGPWRKWEACGGGFRLERGYV